MHKSTQYLLWVVRWGLSVGLVLSVEARAASFDCAKVQTQMEKMICKDAELSKLDEELAAAYTKALQSKSQSAGIKQSQKTWLKYRDGISEDRLVEIYLGRIAYLLKEVAKTTPSTVVFTVVEDDISSNQPNTIKFCQTMADNLNSMPSWPPAYCERPLNPAFTNLKQLQWREWTVEEFDKRWYLLAQFVDEGNSKTLARKGERWTDADTERWRERVRSKEYVVEETMLPENTESAFKAKRLLRMRSSRDNLESTLQYRKNTGLKPLDISYYPDACGLGHFIQLSDDGLTVKASAGDEGPSSSRWQLWLFEIEPGKYQLFDQYWGDVSPGFKTGVLTHEVDTCKILYTKPKQIQGVKK